VGIELPIADPVSRTQVETLRRNCEEFGIRLHPMGAAEQGIVPIIGPTVFERDREPRSSGAGLASCWSWRSSCWRSGQKASACSSSP
jgi:hypothetical protein